MTWPFLLLEISTGSACREVVAVLVAKEVRS